MLVVRILLPAGILVAGIVLVVIGGEINEPMGVGLIGVAVVVVLANVFIRLSLDSQRDRDREQRRRE